MAEIPVVDIIVTEATFVQQELRQRQAEMSRIPEWLLHPHYRSIDYGRRECSQRHLFVNSHSRYCHICGEAR